MVLLSTLTNPYIASYIATPISTLKRLEGKNIWENSTEPNDNLRQSGPSVSTRCPAGLALTQKFDIGKSITATTTTTATVTATTTSAVTAALNATAMAKVTATVHMCSSQCTIGGD